MHGLVALAASIGTAVTHNAHSSQASFTVYDALSFRGKPDSTHLGLVPMGAVARIWRPGIPKEEVDEAGIEAAVRSLPPGMGTVYVDIENWPLLIEDQKVRAASVEKYIKTAQIIRRARPELKFGFYGVAPTCVYWPIVRNDSAGLERWRAVNRMLRPLAEWVDFVLPSLYTFYDDPEGWRTFALATIEEARQYGKPVFPFLLNEYPEMNVLLGDRVVKREAWREELTLCRSRTDGVVLWGGNARVWDDKADWWLSVRELLLNGARGAA